MLTNKGFHSHHLGTLEYTVIYVPQREPPGQNSMQMNYFYEKLQCSTSTALIKGLIKKC